MPPGSPAVPAGQAAALPASASLPGPPAPEQLRGSQRGRAGAVLGPAATPGARPAALGAGHHR